MLFNGDFESTFIKSFKDFGILLYVCEAEYIVYNYIVLNGNTYTYKQTCSCNFMDVVDVNIKKVWLGLDVILISPSPMPLYFIF